MRVDFVIGGTQKGGTSALDSFLRQHPEICMPETRKELHFFDREADDTDYKKYHANFKPKQQRVIGEASPIYMYWETAPYRIWKYNPKMKWILALRNPVERAFSAYKHEYARGFEWETFEQALKLEDDRLIGEIDRMRADPSYESFPHRHHSYRHRGHYAEQLERVFAHFPRSQVHIIESEAFFADPAAEYQHLMEFLGLRLFKPTHFGCHNARPGDPMGPETRRELEQYYQPHDERLASLLGRSPWWLR